jgi:hypothetical protein
LGRPPEEFFDCLIDDPNQVPEWRDSPDATDFRIPSSNWCALKNLRMALMLDRCPVPSIEKLWEHACAFEVYILLKNGNWEGARHTPMAAFWKEYGYTARWIKDIGAEVMANFLARGYYVMPSVDPAIRFPDDREPEKKFSHFVFIYKYDWDEARQDRVFTLNNCAGYAHLGSQCGFHVPQSRLDRMSYRRAFVFRPFDKAFFEPIAA